MRIAFDLDMTLNNMAYTWLAWLRENIDPNFTLDQVKYFGWIRDAYGKQADTYWKDPKAYDEIKPLSGAVQLLADMVKHGHEPFILTHTPEGQSSEVKDAWILEHLGEIPIVHSGLKHHHTKGCILVDDHPGHVQRHVRHNENCQGIVYNDHGHYGWAYPLTKHPRVHTACTYDQLRYSILRLTNER